MPSVPFTGLTVKVAALQMVAAWLLISGSGLTVTVTVNVFPVQVPDSGVTV